MGKKPEKLKFPSELRLDLVSKDWVVIATGRARRPETFKQERRKTEEGNRKACPFCNIETQELPTLIYSQGKKIPIPKDPTPLERRKILTGWTTLSIPNKFPAVIPILKFDKNMVNLKILSLNRNVSCDNCPAQVKLKELSVLNTLTKTQWYIKTKKQNTVNKNHLN